MKHKFHVRILGIISEMTKALVTVLLLLPVSAFAVPFVINPAVGVSGAMQQTGGVIQGYTVDGISGFNFESTMLLTVSVNSRIDVQLDDLGGCCESYGMKIDGVTLVPTASSATSNSFSNVFLSAGSHVLTHLIVTTNFSSGSGRYSISAACPDAGGCVVDDDSDGVANNSDLCPGTAASDSVDANGCADAQVDGDGDGVCNPGAASNGPSACTGTDNCPTNANPQQEDLDSDGLGDVCDPDDDNDGVDDGADNCPVDANAGQEDLDSDGLGDVCDPDDDNDGIDDGADNCPIDANAGQEDFDTDGLGDACDPDDDNDGVGDDADACSETVIGEAVPTIRLGTNRWALVDGDLSFDTTAPKGGGKGPRRSYTTTDTAGCSCAQIIEAQDLGRGHTKYGCSISAMDDWVAAQQ